MIKTAPRADGTPGQSDTPAASRRFTRAGIKLSVWSKRLKRRQPAGWRRRSRRSGPADARSGTAHHAAMSGPVASLTSSIGPGGTVVPPAGNSIENGLGRLTSRDVSENSNARVVRAAIGSGFIAAIDRETEETFSSQIKSPRQAEFGVAAEAFFKDLLLTVRPVSHMTARSHAEEYILRAPRGAPQSPCPRSDHRVLRSQLCGGLAVANRSPHADSKGKFLSVLRG